ncbi:MAG: hypothetical protein JWL77_5297 [Chthonomonadaceae bacterium]|nr:hypothetical protein [Chthonomonadaceae bacterium]
MNPLREGIANLPGLVHLWAESLLHACWQGALLVVAIAILCRALTRLPAGARCALWWLACLKLLLGLVWIPPVAVPLLPAPQSHASMATSAITPGHAPSRWGQPSPLPETPAAPSTTGGATTSVTTRFAPDLRITAVRYPGLMTLLFAVWLIGALFRLTISMIPVRRVQRLLAAADVVHDPEVQEMMEEMARRSGLRHAPTLLLSEAATEPLAVSHWQNIVLLSKSDFERLSPEEVRAVLAHEFAHIRRADLWLGLVPLAAQIVFWFYPFAWLACHEFTISREAACDAAALQTAQTPTRIYSELLLKLGTRHIPLGPAVALGATSQYRILQRRIIMMHQTPRCSQRLLIAGMTALFIPIIGLGLVPWQIVAAQTATEAGKKPDAARTIPPTETQGTTAKTAAGSQEPAGPINLDFAQGMEGWRYDYADGDQNYFDHGIDPAVRHNGIPSPFLFATANLPRIYGVISQWIDAKPYHGKRMRFSAYIKTQGVKVCAGPMFGLTGGEHPRNYIMKNQPIKGDTDWKRYEYVADVDADTDQLVLGMNLSGKGKVWMNHLTLEEVGKDVALSPDKLMYTSPSTPKMPARPINMDFAQGIKGWSRFEQGDSSTPIAYRSGVDRGQAQHGIASAFLTSDGSQPNGYANLVQYIDPAVYQGKRIRLTAVIKTADVTKYAGPWIAEASQGATVWDAEHVQVKAPTDWTPISLVIDVPKDCTSLGFGIMIKGVGKIWVSRITLETVGTDIPTSQLTLHIPSNN